MKEDSYDLGQRVMPRQEGGCGRQEEVGAWVGWGVGTACLSKPWKWGAPKARGKPRGPRVPLPPLTTEDGRKCLARGHQEEWQSPVQNSALWSELGDGLPRALSGV